MLSWSGTIFIKPSNCSFKSNCPQMRTCLNLRLTLQIIFGKIKNIFEHSWESRVLSLRQTIGMLVSHIYWGTILILQSFILGPSCVKMTIFQQFFQYIFCQYFKQLEVDIVLVYNFSSSFHVQTFVDHVLTNLWCFNQNTYIHYLPKWPYFLNKK